jgi:hypothetical protein
MPGALSDSHVPALTSARKALIASSRATVRRTVHDCPSALVSKKIESLDESWRMRQKRCCVAL